MVLIWGGVLRLRFAGYASVILGMIIEAILDGRWQRGSDLPHRQAFAPSRNIVQVKDCVDVGKWVSQAWSGNSFERVNAEEGV